MPAFGLVVDEGDPLLAGEVSLAPVAEGFAVDDSDVGEPAATPGKRSLRQSSGMLATKTLWSLVGQALTHVTKGAAAWPSHVPQTHLSKAAPVSFPSHWELTARVLVQFLMHWGLLF